MKRKRKRKRKRKAPAPKMRRCVPITDDLVVMRGRYCKIMRPDESKLALFSKSRQEVVFKCDTMTEIADLSAKCAQFDYLAAIITRRIQSDLSAQTNCTDESGLVKCTQSHTPDESP